MKIEVSTGEVLDKISILELKLSHFQDENKKKNVRKELETLINSVNESQLGELLIDTEGLYRKLLEVNAALWLIEDKIREKERLQEFDEEFIELARSVYIMNDDRGRIKRQINEETNSLLIEEKEYVDYTKEEKEDEEQHASPQVELMAGE